MKPEAIVTLMFKEVYTDGVQELGRKRPQQLQMVGHIARERYGLSDLEVMEIHNLVLKGVKNLILNNK